MMNLDQQSMMAAVRVIQANKAEDECTRELARNVYRGYVLENDVTPEQVAEMMAAWDHDRDLGEAVLREYVVSQSQHRTTIFPDCAENQIAVDAGYLALHPAWSVYTFTPLVRIEEHENQ